MYITNIKHLISASKKMHEEMPPEARELIGFLTRVIEATTLTLHNSLSSSDVSCFRKSCDGNIKSALRPDTEEIHWFCPDCESEGLINGWQGTEWDKRV
jgi:hypothetical protein